MTAKKSDLKEFSVCVKFTADVSVNVKAESLEDAIAKGREYKVSDFLNAEYELFDYEPAKVTSVWERT